MSGFYCRDCGALYKHPGSGIITCQKCGHLGLRGFSKVPRRVTCPYDECDFTGWNDGGVNDDLPRHLRHGHPNERPTADLMLGGTSPNKVVHHAACRHARTPYGWARKHETWRSLADELVATGAWQWHRFCRQCCQDGVDAIDDAMTREHA